MKFNELEACDGLSYLVSLDDGLPQIPNVDSYIRIVKDKAVLRRIIFASQHMMNRCHAGRGRARTTSWPAPRRRCSSWARRASRPGCCPPARSCENYEGGLNAFLDPSKRIKGISTGFTKLDEYTGGLHGGDLFILAARPVDGQDRAGAEHRPARGPEAETDGGGFFARNVQGIAAHAHAVRGGARGQPAVSAPAS